jgi:hypothetical protein
MEGIMKYMSVLLGAMWLAGILAATAAEGPGEVEIKAASENPLLITNLLVGASTEQASAIVVQVVDKIDQMQITPEEKKTRVGLVMASVQNSMGEQAPPVLQEVIPNINPNLLPPVAVGGPAPIGTLGLPIALPLAPPVAPRYPGQ